MDPKPLKLIPREAMLCLEPFKGLDMQRIRVPGSASELAQARAELLGSKFVGFDTEVKPTFNKGEPLRGPDVVQFSTNSFAYVLQMHDAGHEALAREVLICSTAIKVGFDLRHDQAQLMLRFGAHAQPLLDLDFVFHGQGYPKNIGIKAAIALLFNKRLMKSKRVGTSNWSNRQLEPRQLLYAANDAYAALRVLDALNLQVNQLPVWNSGLPARCPEPD